MNRIAPKFYPLAEGDPIILLFNSGKGTGRGTGKGTKVTYLLLFLIFPLLLFSQPPSPAKLRTLYNSLDPTSIAQHLAFYELYPNSAEGSRALRDAYQLLAGCSSPGNESSLPLSLSSTVNALVNLINQHSSDETRILLKPEELAIINKLAARLPNRRLRGFWASSEEEIKKLPIDQIDLARAILLSQLGSHPETMQKVKSYEASIDLMALQILTRVSLQDAPQAKIRAINRFIFQELGFRFPPHSTYAKDIDLYTFLPSVLDSRKGVCLGVSILYICLAQRLNLELEIVTPPGHIFVSCKQENKNINIETTARGVHLPDEEYLGVDTRALQKRNIKETIGMAYFNQASVFLEKRQYSNALVSYHKALEYLPDDQQLLSLMAYTSLLNGDETKGKELLQQVVDQLPAHAVSKETMPEDYLNGNASLEGIRAIFMRVDETRASLLAKKDELEKALIKTPLFREALFTLAGTWLQLHRASEALEALKRYHEIDPNNASVEYYLAALYAERIDYNQAWHHLRLAEKLVGQRQHDPEALNDLRYELAERYPE